MKPSTGLPRNKITVPLFAIVSD